LELHYTLTNTLTQVRFHTAGGLSKWGLVLRWWFPGILTPLTRGSANTTC